MTGNEPPRLLILGASTRAAAFSALRARWAPVCGDLFADVDLRGAARVLDVRDYPRGLVAAARTVPPSVWIYTGAVENHPQIVAAVSRRHRLLGNPPEVLAVVRNPQRWAGILSTAGLDVLDVRAADCPPAADGTWLLKPLRGAAGRGIRVWVRGTGVPKGQPYFFQRRAAGEPHSAVFLGDGCRARLIGCCRQFVGDARLAAPLFAYCGSLGPAAIPSEARRWLSTAADALAGASGLRGVFGIDFLLEGEQVWVTEINPRYTASVEVLEHALGEAVLACGESAVIVGGTHGSCRLSAEAVKRTVVGKWIVYADRQITVPAGWRPRSLPHVEPGLLPAIADIPSPGTDIRCRRPICTLLACGRDEAECTAGLAERLAELPAALRPGGPAWRR